MRIDEKQFSRGRGGLASKLDLQARWSSFQDPVHKPFLEAAYPRILRML